VNKDELDFGGIGECVGCNVGAYCNKKQKAEREVRRVKKRTIEDARN